MGNPRVFMDFAIEGEGIGRVIFELFHDIVPKTVDNLRALCTGCAGVSTTSGVPLVYRGSPLHRIIAGFMVQGGDFTLRNGKGGESIYGAPFDDEDLRRGIDDHGLLCMANKGKNTNGSQFFVSLRPCPHLDGKHVVLGKIVKGYEIIEDISRLAVDAKDVPLRLVTISNCGELVRKVPVPVVRSPSPSRSRSISVASSRSRSASPELISDRKHSSSKRSSKPHRDRDENGQRLHRSKKHRSSKDEESDRKREKREKKEQKLKAAAEAVEETNRAVAAQEAMIAADLEIERQANERLEEEKRVERNKGLEEMKKRYETVGPAKTGGIQYKGRGAMKAPNTGGMRGW